MASRRPEYEHSTMTEPPPRTRFVTDVCNPWASLHDMGSLHGCLGTKTTGTLMVDLDQTQPGPTARSEGQKDGPSAEGNDMAKARPLVPVWLAPEWLHKTALSISGWSWLGCVSHVLMSPSSVPASKAAASLSPLCTKA